MSKRSVFLFFCSIILLIVSEYLLLSELMLIGNDAPLLVLSSAGLLTSIFFIIRFYNEWRNSLK